MTNGSVLNYISVEFLLRAVIAILFAAFAFGILLSPYQDLPYRVESLEDSNRLLDGRLLEQERKLDLVICFLEMDANGMNPLACSR